MDDLKRAYFAFERLEVWQEAMRLIENIYKITQDFPKSESYGLTDQLRRATTSIALNIAEGKGRYHTKEFVQFLYLARGSLYETVTCLWLATRLNYIQSSQLEKLFDQTTVIQRQLNSLINVLKQHDKTKSKVP